MTSREIAEQLVEILTDRMELSSDSVFVYPAVEATRDYVSVTVAGAVVWDDEDENDNPEDGETVDTALSYAEREIGRMVEAFSALLPEKCVGAIAARTREE